MSLTITEKVERENYHNEESFINDLTEEEANYLNRILRQEIYYAKNVDDHIRARELNDIYERLV